MTLHHSPITRAIYLARRKSSTHIQRSLDFPLSTHLKLVGLATTRLPPCSYQLSCLLRPFGRLWWDETVPTVVTFPSCHRSANMPPMEYFSLQYKASYGRETGKFRGGYYA